MRERIERAIEGMRTAGVDAMILTPGADLFYLTGFEHSHAGERLLALILHPDGSTQWIAPAMNVPQVEERAMEGQNIRGWNDTEWYTEALREAVAGAKSIAFDDEARSRFLVDLIAVAPHAKIVPASDIMRTLRIRKDPAELAELAAVAKQVDQAIATAIEMCRPGRSEAEIDQELRTALLKLDPTSAIAFTIIASGPNSALPHHETAGRKLQHGDVVILDYGTRGTVPVSGKTGESMSRSYGYQSDITVTCSVGEPADPEVRKIYQIVWEAQQAAIHAVRPGATCEQIDHAARAVIESAGYGQFFPHRTGHGLGLQGHEPPFIRSGDKELLEEGMVFSIEPGIYLPGRFGVRLEIIVSVAAEGVKLINAPSAPELPVATGL